MSRIEQIKVSASAPLSRRPNDLEAVVNTLAAESKGSNELRGATMAGETVPQAVVNLAAMRANAPPPRTFFEPAKLQPSQQKLDTGLREQKSMFGPMKPFNYTP